MPRKQVFRIKRRSGLGLKLDPVTAPLRKKPEMNPLPEIKPIQGIMPDSKEEYWVALALYRLKIDFNFQYQLFGGRKYKGGQVVDFWIKTVPLPTPLLVQGWYFHYSTAQRTAQTKLNIMYLKSRLVGKANEPVEVLDIEIPTPEDAFIVVKRKLKR